MFLVLFCLWPCGSVPEYVGLTANTVYSFSPHLSSLHFFFSWTWKQDAAPGARALINLLDLSPERDRLRAAESAQVRDFCRFEPLRFKTTIQRNPSGDAKLSIHPMSFTEGSQKTVPREKRSWGAGISGQLGGLALSRLARGGQSASD